MEVKLQGFVNPGFEEVDDGRPESGQVSFHISTDPNLNDLKLCDSSLKDPEFKMKVHLEPIQEKPSEKDNKKSLKVGWRRYLGIMFALLNGACNTLLGLIAKVLDDMDLFTITAYRFSGTLILGVILTIYYTRVNSVSPLQPIWPPFGSNNNKNNKFRTFMSVQIASILAAIIFTFRDASLGFIPLSDVTAIILSSQIFVVISAHFLLGEHCGFLTVPISVLTIIGTIIVARPPFLTGEENFNIKVLIGIGLGFGAVLSTTAYYLISRKIRQIHCSIMNLFGGIQGVIPFLILAFIFGAPRLPKSLWEGFLVTSLSVLAVASLVGIIMALKYEEAGTVSMIKTADVIFAFTWQYIFLGVVPDFYSILGGILIMVGVFLIILRKKVSSLPEESSFKRRCKWLLR